jgi:catechol 2,3-dioxygenase-like lactoylglutathione lyase family enzyme
MNAPAPVAPTQTDAIDKIVPSKLAHYVIRAKHFEEMLAWYRKVFHMKTSFEAPVIAFLSYDDEHHRIAFLNTAHLPAPDTMRTGIDHVAFTYGSLSDLLHTWERLKGEGITPFWCINHGMTTSMYFRDPDGNEIEFQVDNFATMDESRAWFSSPAFAANPLGVQYDPELLMKRFREGVPESELLKQGAAPLPKEKEYVFTTLPPPPG